MSAEGAAWLVYGRDRRPPTGLRLELAESHWSYMDRFADRLIARGPTLDAAGETATGSLHVVSLPDLSAARAFAFEEPYQRAGIFGEVLIRRWENDLGRTMWDYPATDTTNSRFLVLAHGGEGHLPASLARAQRRFLDARREALILNGPMVSDDGESWRGTALCVQLPSATDAEALITESPIGQAGAYRRVEVHRWRFGGRSQPGEEERLSS